MASPPEKLSAARIAALLPTISGDWELRNDELTRTVQLRDFRAAIAFVNRIADHAEAEAHHPDITVKYNRVTLVLTTHDAGGLSGKDFVLAAKIDLAAR